jgi:hypothetical protein
MKYLMLLLFLSGCAYGSYQQQYDRAAINLRTSFPTAKIWKYDGSYTFFVIYDPNTRSCYKANLGDNMTGIANIELLLPMDTLYVKEK